MLHSWIGMALRAFGLLMPAFFLCPAKAIACLSFSAAPPLAQITYDPFNPAPARVALSLEVRNNDSKRCSGAVAFFKPDKAEASSPAGRRLSYALESASGSNLLNAAARSSSQLGTESILPILDVAPGETRTISYYLIVPPGQVVPPGAYASTAEGVLYQTTGSVLKQTGKLAPISINIAVAAVMSINIAGGGLSTTLDFGMLEAGATRSAIVQTRSNERYRLIATSENGGVLKLDPPSGDGISWMIPYSVRIDNGMGLLLRADKKLEIRQPPTSLAGTNLPVEVKIGDTAHRRAGRYKDVIVLSIDGAP